LLLQQLLRDELELKENGRPAPGHSDHDLHKTAVWIANGAAKPFEIASEQQRQKALDAARATLQPAAWGMQSHDSHRRHSADLRDDYLLEEFDWVIEGQNCRSEADYLAANADGAGYPLPGQNAAGGLCLVPKLPAAIGGQRAGKLGVAHPAGAG
jgi:hypothetical protein